MPLLPDAQIEAARRADLKQLVQSYGIDLKKHGQDWVGCCPFHEDKTPSFVVSPGKNLWHCLGACSRGGSSIDFVMQMDGVTFRDAVLKLSGDSFSLVATPSAAKQEKVQGLDWQAHADLYAAFVAHCQSVLQGHDKARTYLGDRGLLDDDVLRVHGVGFDDGSFQKGYGDLEVLRVAGLVGRGAGSSKSRFMGKIVVPLFDQGQIVNLYGRSLFDDSGRIAHLYMPGAQRGLFNPAALESGHVILCESVLDALSLYRLGFTNTTCSFGVHGCHSQLLQRLQDCQSVVIAYDNDVAGCAAADALAQQLPGVEVRRLHWPQTQDANAFLVANGEQAQAKVADLLASSTRYGEQNSGYVFGDRRYRVRGLEKNTSFDSLRVVLRAERKLDHDTYMHIDSLDMLIDKQRQHFIQRASMELEVDAKLIKSDMGKLLLQLEDEQDRLLTQNNEPERVELSAQEHIEAMELLQDPKLIPRLQSILDEILVGEETNKLLAYLGVTSRLLDKPLAIIIQSSSAAGKSTLMEAVLQMLPDEQCIKYSAMTGQSLYYMDKDLRHKVLAIVEEEGAQRASYSLKLLQSEGELSISSVAKDPKSGRMESQDYNVQGPVMILLTTTASDLDEELLNRCLVLSVDESTEQTKRIHAVQRQAETLDALIAKEKRNESLRIAQNAQRLLQSVAVVNPFAKDLAFVSHSTRTRRDHTKYLSLIKTIALLHQFQRQTKTVQDGTVQKSYIEVQQSDIALADTLMEVVLQRCLDELPPQTRKVYEQIESFVAAKEEKIFCRRDLREAYGLGDTQLKIHLARLVDMEYLQVHKTEEGRYAYSL